MTAICYLDCSWIITFILQKIRHTCTEEKKKEKIKMKKKKKRKDI